MSGDESDLVSYRLERAREALVEAQTMADIGHANACVPRPVHSLDKARIPLLRRLRSVDQVHEQTCERTSRRLLLTWLSRSIVLGIAIRCLRRSALI